MGQRIELEPYSKEKELKMLLDAYSVSHSRYIIDEKQKAENEKVKVITEHSLYSFCLGLYWAASMNKSQANDGETN